MVRVHSHPRHIRTRVQGTARQQRFSLFCESNEHLSYTTHKHYKIEGAHLVRHGVQLLLNAIETQGEQALPLLLLRPTHSHLQKREHCLSQDSCRASEHSVAAHRCLLRSSSCIHAKLPPSELHKHAPLPHMQQLIRRPQHYSISTTLRMPRVLPLLYSTRM
jgi:hypothetical protein